LLPDDFDQAPPLRKEPKALISISALKIFGQPEVLDNSWTSLVCPPEKKDKKTSAPIAEGAAHD
jgi:hypothetical protein